MPSCFLPRLRAHDAILRCPADPARSPGWSNSPHDFRKRSVCAQESPGGPPEGLNEGTMLLQTLVYSANNASGGTRPERTRRRKQLSLPRVPRPRQASKNNLPRSRFTTGNALPGVPRRERDIRRSGGTSPSSWSARERKYSRMKRNGHQDKTKMFFFSS